MASETFLAKIVHWNELINTFYFLYKLFYTSFNQVYSGLFDTYQSKIKHKLDSFPSSCRLLN